MTTTVPADVASRALRREVDPGCHLSMTPRRGTVALVLPERPTGLPHTTVLQLRLATIARDIVAAGRTRVLRSLARPFRSTPVTRRNSAQGKS